MAQRVCSARRTNGEPCRAQAIRGGNVCVTHGGAAPQVKAAADARIAALVDPALIQLARLIDSAETDAVKLAAVKDALDRAGYKPKEKADINVTGSVTIESIRKAIGVGM